MWSVARAPVFDTDERTMPHDRLAPAKKAIDFAAFNIHLDVVQPLKLGELAVHSVDMDLDHLGRFGLVCACPKPRHTVTDGEMIKLMLADSLPQRDGPDLYIRAIRKLRAQPLRMLGNRLKSDDPAVGGENLGVEPHVGADVDSDRSLSQKSSIAMRQ